MFQEDYFKTNEFRETLAIFEQARQEGRNIFLDASDLSDIAEYYYTDHQHALAKEVLEHGLYLYPHATLLLTYKARVVLWEEHNVGKARQLLALCDDTTYPEYMITMAELLIAEENDDKAQTYLQRYVQSIAAEEGQEAVFDVIALLADYHVYTYAEYWLAQAPTLKGTPEYLELSAGLAEMNKDFRKAKECYEQLLDIDPFNVNTWRSVADCYFEEDDLNKAFEAIQYALSIEPDNKELLYKKALCFIDFKNYHDALPILQQLQRISDGAFLYYPIALCLSQEGQQEEAVRMLYKAAQNMTIESAFAPDVYKMLADITEQSGDVEEAKKIREMQLKAEQYLKKLEENDSKDKIINQ